MQKTIVLTGIFAATLIYSEPAAFACTAIKTYTDVNNIRNDMAGDYCLVKDIDLSPITTFIPMPGSFSGTLDGQGHVIKNANIGASSGDAGLFLNITGVVKNIGFVNSKVSSCGFGSAGPLAASIGPGATLTNVYSTGSAACGGALQIGGLVGLMNASTIDQSYSTVKVASLNNVSNTSVGGLVGRMFSGTIKRSYAAGPVSGGTGTGGGLVGLADGTVENSFALGRVDAAGGGLVGGGATTISRSYAAGHVGTGGGLAGANSGVVDHSYWDVQTTAQSTSANGTPMTTAMLQVKLRAGFTETNWAITSKTSYPYLNLPGMNFHAPLATVVRNSKLYIFLPISQNDVAQYSSVIAAQKSQFASLAAVYTIIARGIGVADSVSSLQNELIDTDFWNYQNKSVKWQGPVTAHATLGALNLITGAIDDSNVIGFIKLRRAVILRGSYTRAGTATAHWMLATSFTTNGDGSLKRLIADDPWTGSQVEIDPVSKLIVDPGFPLADFTVNAFMPVTLN